jgi:hypothetical protein
MSVLQVLKRAKQHWNAQTFVYLWVASEHHKLFSLVFQKLQCLELTFSCTVQILSARCLTISGSKAKIIVICIINFTQRHTKSSGICHALGTRHKEGLQTTTLISQWIWQPAQLEIWMWHWSQNGHVNLTLRAQLKEIGKPAVKPNCYWI